MQWVSRDLPLSMQNWMVEKGIQFNNNIREFELGHNGAWILLTGTDSGYQVGEYIMGVIKGKSGNVLHGVGISLHSMTESCNLLETFNILPGIRAG